MRCRVVAHDDDGQMGLYATFTKHSDATGKFGFNFTCACLTIQSLG